MIVRVYNVKTNQWTSAEMEDLEPLADVPLEHVLTLEERVAALEAQNAHPTGYWDVEPEPTYFDE